MTVTIGQLTNVPAPGDDLRSPWAQDVTKLGMHVFADRATLLATWASAPNGSHAYTTAENTHWVRISGSWQQSGEASGMIDIGTKAADSGPAPFTTITNFDSTNLRVDVTIHPPGRWVRVSAFCRAFTAATATERCDMILRRILSAGAAVDQQDNAALCYGVAGAVAGPGAYVEWTGLLGAGDYAWVLAGLRVGGGTGNFTFSGTATAPTMIVATDLGGFP